MKRRKALEHPARTALSACTSPMLVLLLLSLGINLLALTTPLYLLHLYSHVIPSGSVDTLIVLTAMALAALLTFVVLEALRKRALAQLADWYDDAVRPAALRAGINVALEGARGDAARLWREVSAVRGFLASSHVTTLLDVPWVPVFLVALFLVHPVLGLIALVGGGVLGVLALLGDLLVRQASLTSLGAGKRAEARWDTLLGSARAIRAMGLLPGVSRTLYELHDEMLDHNETVERRSAVIEACSRFVRLSTQVAVMAGATVLVVSYGLNPGAIFAASLLLSRALAPVERAMPVWRAISAVRPALQHLDDATTGAKASLREVALPEPIGRLSVEAVTHRPAGRRDATLRRISFEAEPGDVLGVVGPSGSGKSTLAQIVVGAIDPSIGRVRLDGADISLWQAAGAERHIGYLPQQVELAGETVRDAIARMQEHDPADVFEAAKRAGVHDAIMRMERGYETPLGDGGGSLSGGQRQLVGLARALYGAPRLLVLDEPNAALDTQGEGHLRRAIVEAARGGATVIVVAQHSSILDVATRRLVLDDGVVVSLGTPSHVLPSRKAGTPSIQALPNPLDPSVRRRPDGVEPKRSRTDEELQT